jgi:riboflavin kinase/FMN adenylyltransferase
VVVAGRRLGRALGFPTANIDVSSLELPPWGVYAARAILQGTRQRAVVNLGRKPTVEGGGAAPLLEVHLLDIHPDLYGCELEVELVRMLRPERRFPSIEALREQIARDAEAARELLG